MRIGISGWRYPGWRGVSYPKGLPQKNELSFASRKFSSIEINGTFYSLQRPERFGQWAEETPDDFVFALKGARFITHMKKLSDVRTPLANFFASGPLRLGKKLGPILWQLPPNFVSDTTRTGLPLSSRCCRTTPKPHPLSPGVTIRSCHRALSRRANVPLLSRRGRSRQASGRPRRTKGWPR
jgi:hypothetical protein